MMRVIIPVVSLDHGGGERVLAEVANGLVARGHEVVLVIPYGGRVAWPIRAQIAWVPALTPGNLPYGDILLPNFYPTVPPALQSGRGRCVRLCLAYEPLWLDRPEVQATYDLPMPYIVISEWQRQLVQNRTGRPAFLLHPGVDLAAFHPQPGVDGLPKRVLYISRTSGYAWKGQGDFLAAHAILGREIPDLQVQVVCSGPGDHYYPLPSTPKTAADDVEMGQIYAQVEVFAYPSHFESFGLPPLEAMACGTAVVAADCGGIREYARHLENCLLVEAGNPRALASTIGALLRDIPARQRLVRGGLRTAAAWSWQRTYHEIEQILLTILRG